jgi:hypothetical protein
MSSYSDLRANNPSRNGRRPAMIRRASSSTTPPHMLDRQIMPTSPQLSRPSINYYDGTERTAQTPRRQRNGIGYVNGSSVIRPVSREGATSYVRDGSPAVPALQRAQTSSSALSDMTVSRSRLPRQSGAHRLSRQSTRESINGGYKDSTTSTPTLTPVNESRRKENAQGERDRDRANRQRNVEIHASQQQPSQQPPRRTITAGRRHNTAPDNSWA